MSLSKGVAHDFLSTDEEAPIKNEKRMLRNDGVGYIVNFTAVMNIVHLYNQYSIF